MTENEFHEHLRSYPELRARFEQLLTIVENANGESTLADEAEQQVIKELRILGKDALQSWANHQSTKVAGHVREQKPHMRQHVKKNFSGTPVMEK